ncbi:MAG: DUF3429 domain-containing protein [Pseudomonadota bacterium]
MSVEIGEISEDHKKIAWAMALGGFIPFLGLSASAFFGFTLGLPIDPTTLYIYWSLAILSFLGGIRWGLAIANNPIDIRNLAWSVVPCIIAWFSLLLPDGYTITALLLLYLIQGYWDFIYFKDKAWFANIRATLTVLVASTHVLTLFS